MHISTEHFNPSSNSQLLLTYVADLELEVDRLRKHGQFLRQEAREMLGSLEPIGRNGGSLENAESDLAAVAQAAQKFSGVMQDLYDPPGYHPAHDQVIAFAVRPLVEQIFRWQQRLQGAPHAVLHLDLACESIEWFPARFRHIIDNLISNAVKHRDPEKGETRVVLCLNRLPDAVTIRITDNGRGMPWNKREEAFELFYRLLPSGASGLGVGLAVVKLLVEQSGGSLTVESSEGQGTSFAVVLPRFDAGDHLS